MAIRMPDNISSEFDEASLTLVWDILRRTEIPKLVGNHYCPVPYVDRPQYFDMFNVYRKKTKTFSEKLRKMAGKRSKFAFVGKLGDVLEIPNRKDADTLAMATAIGQDKYHEEIPDFNVVMKSEDGQKEISLKMQGIKMYVSNLTFTMSKAYVNIRRYPVFAKSLYAITNVCAADKLSLEFRWQKQSIRSVQDWKFKGPVPIAIKITKFDVKKDGRLGSQESVPIDRMLEVRNWSTKYLRRPFLPGCESLKLYLKGEKSDATRHSRSLHRMHLNGSSKKSKDSNKSNPETSTDSKKSDTKKIETQPDSGRTDDYISSTTWEKSEKLSEPTN